MQTFEVRTSERCDLGLSAVSDVERWAIVGSPGSGKSTLARALGARLDLPVVHFDALHFAPGWVERSREETQARVDDALAGDRWISDGNYRRYSAERDRRVQCVVWLDLPRSVCTRRVLKRITTSYGRVRPDMAEGCPEQLDPAFLRWTWNWRRDQRPGVLDRFLASEVPWVWLRRPAQVDVWLRSLGPGPLGAAA